MSALFCGKKLRIFRNLWCVVRTDKEGKVFTISCGLLLWTAPNTSSVIESSDDVASSYKTTGGFFNIARAIATLCFSPPDNFNPRSPTYKHNLLSLKFYNIIEIIGTVQKLLRFSGLIQKLYLVEQT